MIQHQVVRSNLRKGIRHLLRVQIYQFLDSAVISNADYSKTCDQVGGSCGQHIRHVDDHFRCLVTNLNLKKVSPAHSQSTHSTHSTHSTENKTTVHCHIGSSMNSSNSSSSSSSSSSTHRYDVFRNRESDVETSLSAAKTSILSLDHTIQTLLTEQPKVKETDILSTSVKVTFLTGGQETMFDSNIARELNFCLHHAYHHCASIKIIAQNNGFDKAIPDMFGIAPSTVRYNEVE